MQELVSLCLNSGARDGGSVYGIAFRALGSGFTFWGLGVRVQGSIFQLVVPNQCLKVSGGSCKCAQFRASAHGKPIQEFRITWETVTGEHLCFQRFSHTNFWRRLQSQGHRLRNPALSRDPSPKLTYVLNQSGFWSLGFSWFSV